MKKLIIIGKILIILSLAMFMSFFIYNYYQNNKEIEMIDNYIEETKIIEEQIDVQEQEVIEEKQEQKINYTAVLEIPSINLKRGVVDSTKNFNSINYAISVDKNSNYPDKEGNFILYAHSGNSSIAYFKNLNKVEIDDEVYVYYKGVKYKYKIFTKYDIEKTGKAEVLFSNTEKYITLITCNQNRNGYQVILIGKMFSQSNY